VSLDAGVEADVAGLADKLGAFRGRVELATVDELGDFLVLLAVIRHLDLLLAASGLPVRPPLFAGSIAAFRRICCWFCGYRCVRETE